MRITAREQRTFYPKRIKERAVHFVLICFPAVGEEKFKLWGKYSVLSQESQTAVNLPAELCSYSKATTAGDTVYSDNQAVI